MSNRRIAALCVLAVGCAILATPVDAQDLPAGKGRDTLNRVCTVCHDLNVVMALHNTRAEWNSLIETMKGNGAQATDAEFAEIINYLTLNFGPQKESAAKKAPAAPRPVPWEKNRLKIGQALFRQNCIVCHDVEREISKKFGPSFYHLFQREKMPKSNGKPDRSYIAARIKVGGTIMPAFGNKLTDPEIEALITYLASK